MKKLRFWLATIAVLLCSVSVSAQWGDIFGNDFEVDEIHYNITSETNLTVEVTNRGSNNNYGGEVVIPENVNHNGSIYSVTSIGDEAFMNCIALRSVTIPNSVTSIGKNAFYHCSNLTSITIGNSVTSIGDWAFYDCYRLTSITIPNSVTSIGEYAFSSCSNLTNITIPNSVTSIGEYAFYGCSGLTSITVDKNNTIYDSRDNCNAIIETCSNELIVGCKSTVIPNSVTSIGDDAFYGCSDLTSITIPNSVTSIGNWAFSGCTGLTSITIPNSVTSIGDYAFSGCTGLKLVINFSDLNIEKGSTSHGNVASYASKVINADEQIGDFFFKTIDGNHYLLGYIGNDTDLTLPQDYKGEKYIIGDDAFRECTDLTSITIPNSVTSIEDWAFYKCSGLTSITIPNSVTTIGSYAFYKCSGLTSVTIGNSVTSIGDGAFYECSGLTSVTIGNSVTSIGDSAFRGCTDLTSITIPNSVTSIGDYAFHSCSDLTSVTIGNSVTSIGDDAFYNCRNLKTVINFSDLELSTGSTSHGYVAKYASKVINADEQVGDFFFKTINSVHHLNGYLGNGGNLKLPQDYKGEKYSIGSSAFRGRSGLTSIIIPNTVTSIGASAFSGCKGIKELIIEDGSTYIDLGYSQFIDCPLEYVYIGRNHSYTNNPFKEENTLKTVVIGPNVTRIGNYLFDYCKGLKSVTIPNSVTSIGAGVFEDCTGLKELYIGNSITIIPDNLISGCSALEKLYIGTSVKNIGNNLLTGCPNLNTLSVGAKIPPTVNDLGLGSQQYFTVKLQVPEGSKAMYQFADAWKKFFDIEEYDPTGIADITPDAEDNNLPIYNLQGTRMTEEKENLPTGIYIQGGKKIFIK